MITVTTDDAVRAAAHRPAPAPPPRAIPLIAGLATVAFAVALDPLTGQPLTFGKVQALLCGAGVALVLLGRLARGKPFALTVRFSMLLLSLLFMLLAAEGAFRLIGYDFSRAEERFLAHPIYYRWAILPAGEIFNRRPGPDSWTGQVLRTGMRAEGVIDDAYADEAPVTITYDATGFRNPEGLADWEVVVAGDSFVELGYLPYDDLFTTLAGKELNLRVKNLGLCHSGPLAYTYFVNQLGRAPGLRHVVFSFFEGNDLLDLRRECADMQRFRETGRREERSFSAQSSFLLALKTLARPQRVRSQNAHFTAAGRSLPVTVKYVVPGEADVTVEQRRMLESALDGWADAARSAGAKPWLLYMPCKHRVLHQHLRYDENAKPWLTSWRPTDLPQFVRRLAEERGIAVIDPTSALTDAANAGNVPYNLIWDTHLNREGSRIVADAIVQALRGN